MLKDVWDSFKDNIKERTTNPFLGTFAIIWIVHNWPVVYAFFYFDSDWKLEKKINYFVSYWQNKSFIGNLFFVAFITIAVLAITYTFLGLSRFLSNYFENILIPYIHKITRGKIVTIEIHQSALKKIEDLENKIEIERKAKNEAIQERDLLEERLYEKPIEQQKGKDYSNLIKRLTDEFGFKKPEQMLLGISKNDSFEDDSVIDFLLKNNLITFNNESLGRKRYQFTAEGQHFKTQFFSEINR